MSEVRKAFEEQAKGADGMLKAFKIGGWVFIVLGALLCITVIGIPVGIMLIVMGFLLLKVLPNLLKKKFDAVAKAGAEQAEIHEYNLAQVRAAKQAESAK